MSKRRTAPNTSMGPPPDKDPVMGPPPLPPPTSSSPSAHPKPKDAQDLAEKYRKLKRKYYDLEEVGIPRLVICCAPNFHPFAETQGDQHRITAFGRAKRKDASGERVRATYSVHP